MAVPQGERQAQALAAIADPAYPVLAPTIGAAAGVVVRAVIPRVAAGGIILAHRAPLALGEIRTPEFPAFPSRGVLGEALGFGVAWSEVFHRRQGNTLLALPPLSIRLFGSVGALGALPATATGARHSGPQRVRKQQPSVRAVSTVRARCDPGCRAPVLMAIANCALAPGTLGYSFAKSARKMAEYKQ